MKWLILGLLALNILLLIIGFMVREPMAAANDAPKPFPYRDVDSLEIIRGKRVADLAKEADRRNVGQKLCEMVGPFSADDELNAFVERLASLDIRSSLKNVSVSAGKGYWVILGPLKTREQAYSKLRELQSGKIDSFLIPDGELANSISLGFFTSAEKAEIHKKRLALKKVDATIVERERTNDQKWVLIDGEDGASMSSLTWERVLDGQEQLSRRQNLCQDVASG